MSVSTPPRSTGRLPERNIETGIVVCGENSLLTLCGNLDKFVPTVTWQSPIIETSHRYSTSTGHRTKIKTQSCVRITRVRGDFSNEGYTAFLPSMPQEV